MTELTSFLPAQASVANPVDMIASATGEDYGRAIRTVAADPGVDALIVIYIPPLEDAAPRSRAPWWRRSGRSSGRIPVLTCFMSARGLPEPLRAPGVRIPSYAFPEQAAIALAHAAELGRVAREAARRASRIRRVREDEAAAVIAAALARDEGWLSPDEVARSCSTATGSPSVPEASAATAEEAAAAALGSTAASR